MRENAADKRARARKILTKLGAAYPEAAIALHFANPFQLLVATVLSAQCTDERVNMVTPALFAKYPGARELARAHSAALEEAIRSTGFYRAKAKSLLGMARGLVDAHGGEVPPDRAALMALPGVGLKTANVVLGNAFGEQALAVDTHVFRVSQRLGLARAEDPDEIHDQLVALLPRPSLTLATHRFIVHGRRTCTARAPACPVCPVKSLCPWPHKTRSTGSAR